MERNKCDNGTHYIYEILCKPKIMLDIVKQVASYSYYDASTISVLTRSYSNKKMELTVGYSQLPLPPFWRLVEIHQLSPMTPHY